MDGVVVRVASLDDIIASKRAESSRALDELIRRWQALPPGKRTNFLRKRVGICRTAL